MKNKLLKRITTGMLTFAVAVASLAAIPTTEAKAASYVNLQENTQYVIVSRSSGKALTVEGDSTKNEAKIVQQSLTNKESQTWTLKSAGGGYYQIINGKSGKALDIPKSSTEQGTQLIQYSKGSGDNQKFKFSQVGSGYYRITPKIKSNFAFNVYKNSKNNGGKIVQWPYEGNQNEQWEIKKVENVVARIEAEDVCFDSGHGSGPADLEVREVAGASGGKVAGNLYSMRQLCFDVNIEQAGRYYVKVYYATGEDRWLECPEAVETEVMCKSTGSFTKVGSEPAVFEVDFEKGEEGFSLTGISGTGRDGHGWTPDIDYVEVVKKVENVVARIEAEDVCIDYGHGSGPADLEVRELDGASGGKIAGNLYSWRSLDFNVNIKKAGRYYVKVYYASGEERPLMCPEAVEPIVKCKPTGSFQKVGSEPAVFELDFEKGENSFSLTGVDGEGEHGFGFTPDIDYIEVVEK